MRVISGLSLLRRLYPEIGISTSGAALGPAGGPVHRSQDLS